MPRVDACLRAECLRDCKTDRLTASMLSGVREVRGRPLLFLDTLPVPVKFSTHNRMDFRSGTRSRGGGFGSEYGTHAGASLKSFFHTAIDIDLHNVSEYTTFPSIWPVMCAPKNKFFFLMNGLVCAFIQ